VYLVRRPVPGTLLYHSALLRVLSRSAYDIYYMRGISVQTVHDPKMSKISKFRGWPWDGYSVVEDA